MSTLRDFHTAAPKTGNLSKIIGAAVVGAAIGGVVVYGCETGSWNPLSKSVVTDSELPSPGPLPATHAKSPPAT